MASNFPICSNYRDYLTSVCGWSSLGRGPRPRQEGSEFVGRIFIRVQGENSDVVDLHRNWACGLNISPHSRSTLRAVATSGNLGEHPKLQMLSFPRRRENFRHFNSQGIHTDGSFDIQNDGTGFCSQINPNEIRSIIRWPTSWLFAITVRLLPIYH